MTERALAEYFVNAVWQVPLLAGGAWLLLRVVKPGPQIQHGVWLAVLGLAVLLPTRGMGSIEAFDPQPHATVAVTKKPTDSSDLALNKRRPGFEFSPYLHPRIQSLRLSVHSLHWLVRLYVATVVFGLLRIAQGWRGARHLVRQSQPTSAHGAALAYYSNRLGVRPPDLRESAEVSSPLIVGYTAPVLLVPEGFVQFTEEEVGAVLCHELAHIKRQDYLINLFCQIAALPLAWHPVVDEVQQRIRMTREMVCDAIAAQEMNSHIGYARCLLALAHSMLGDRGVAGHALGLFSNNTLEERVMRLMETTSTSMRASAGRVASGAAMMIAAGSVAAMFHVTPIVAQLATGTPAHDVRAVPAAPALTVPPEQPSAPASVKPTPGARVAQRKHLDKKTQQQIEDAQQEMAHARIILNSEKFKLQMEDAQRQAVKATVLLNSPAFKQQMDEAQKQIAKTKALLDSREFKRQMEDAQREASKATAMLNSPAFKQQMEDARRRALKATDMVNSPEFKHQMEDLRKRMRSRDFKLQMDEDLQGLNEPSSEDDTAPTP